QGRVLIIPSAANAAASSTWATGPPANTWSPRPSVPPPRLKTTRARKMKIKAAKMIATWFGCGYAPIGPGTAGSIAALAIAWLLVRYAGWQPLWFVALVLVCAPPFIWAAGVTAHALNQKDPGVVVADEVLGQWLPPAGGRAPKLKSWVWVFLL